VRELTRSLLALGEPLSVVALGGQPVPFPIEQVPEPWHPPTNFGWSTFGVLRAARGAALDLYHAPAYVAPPLGIRRMVITLHDVSYERRPEWYPHRRDSIRRLFYRRSANAADLVITDSEFSRREIEAAYGIRPEHIRVIPLGVGDAFAPLDDAPPPQGVSSPFVLHVGDLHTRRNLEVALDGVLHLRRQPGVFSHLSLVLAGLDRGLVPLLEARATAAGDPEAVNFRGHVDEATLVRLYQSASALVYPSRYEGFGLPLVEAMASGTPVLAARAGTSGEVTGDAALLLPEDDSGAWAEAMNSVLTSPERAAALRARGLTRARLYSWHHTAAATYQVYVEAAGR